MPHALLVTLALTCLLTPSGLGLLVLPFAGLAGADRSQLVGLALLGLVPLAARPPPVSGSSQEPEAAPRHRQAVEVRGRWRAPPHVDPFLELADRRVAVRLASDLDPPRPGQAIVARGIAEPGRPLRLVDIVERGAISGAWIDRWSQVCDRRLARLLPPDQRGLVGALVLGRRAELPFEVREAARATGTMHLFALSGLHVGLIAGFLEGLAGFMGTRSRLLRLALLAPFVALAGARPSLLRATTGWCVASLAAHRGRSSRSLPRLATVALLVFAWDPGLAHDLSAQLSFVAVAGLLSVAALFSGRLSLWFAPCGAFLATAPLIAETFGRVQPWGLLVTPLLIPLVSGILTLGLVCIVAGPCFSVFDGLAGPALSVLADLLADTLWWSAQLVPPPVWPAPLPVSGLVGSLAVVAALATLAHCRPHPSGDAASAALQKWTQ